MSFAQGNPSVPTLINSSNTLVYSNTSTTGFSVQQLGSGAVVQFSNSSGSVGLFVSSTSNVGINTTNPQFPLTSAGTICGPYSTIPLLACYNQTSGYFTYANVISCSYINGRDSTQIFTPGNGSGGSAGNPIMTLQSGPLVGIGTTNPGYPLQVNTAGTTSTNIASFFAPSLAGTQSVNLLVGSAQTVYQCGVLTWLNYGTNSTNVYQLSMYGVGASSLNLTTTGVGIGTTNPTSLLHVYGGNIQLGSTGTASVYNSVAGSDFGTLTLQSGYQNASSAPRINIVGYTGAGTVNGDNIIQFATNGSTRMTVNQSGYVGIGTTSPGWSLDVYNSQNSQTAVRVYNPNAGAAAASGYFIGTDDSTNRGGLSAFNSTFSSTGQYRASGTYLYNNGIGGVTISSEAANSNVYIATVGSERMRITSAGNVGIGTTNPGPMLDIWATGSTFQTNGSLRFYRSDVGSWWKFVGPDTGNTLYLQPANTSYGVYITATATSWSSASDARLKNIIEPISNALAKVDLLNPVMYSWKTDETNEPHPGLIAQDVLQVQPEAVSTAGDGMYGVKYTELVPLALAAIKELAAENTVLKQSLAALEQSLSSAVANISSLEARLALLEAK